LVSLIVSEVVVSEGEYRLLRLMAERGFSRGSLDEASRLLGVDKSSLASLIMLLRDRGIVRVIEEVRVLCRLTSRGLEALSRGLPEEVLIEYLSSKGGVAGLADVAEALGDYASVALGQARRRGLIVVQGGSVRLVQDPVVARSVIRPLRGALESCSKLGSVEPGLLRELRERGLVEEVKERELVVELVEDPRSLLGRVRVEASRLTSRMLQDGSWRMYRFRAYNVEAEPPRVRAARLHFLQEFIEVIRDVMKELGFKEVRGPIVELELFNFDMLFQAQDHPAREIHDSLWVKAEPLDVTRLYSGLVERVAKVHESGWRYKWSPAIASRLMLRSQTTAVSARTLTLKPRPPIRFFTLGRVYRHDVVDASHLPEFHQLDGIEGDYGYTFRDLLGTLKEICGRLGLEVKFKPGYFPFTEPSVEGYVRLPNGRWLELFGAGLFRPEVLEMAGVDYPVGAWGFGIERLAAAYYGIPDIRILYTYDVEYIREFRVKV
jgi:phenylalanyl-tRNA synthetase alpha chain